MGNFPAHECDWWWWVAYLEPVVGRNEECVAADGLEDGLLSVQHDSLAVRPAYGDK